MTDVSSNYLAGEHKMIETGKGGTGLNPRSKEMTKKSVVSAADTDRDDRSVRSAPKSERSVSIAPTAKVDDDEKGSIVDSYASLRIASGPRVKIADPDDDDEEEEVDEDGAFGSGDEGLEEYSDDSGFEQGDEDEDEDELDYESDGGFEDVDGGFSGYAKIAVDGVEFDHGKTIERKFSPYARISAPDTTEAEHRKYIDRDFSPYARISVAGNDNDKDDGSYARVSVAGSEIDRDAGYARVSVHGSEADFNYGDTNARVSVHGSEGKEMDRESFSGFARISVAGSEPDQNYADRLARVSIAGSDHGRDTDRELPAYAKVSVAGSDHGRETERYARVSVAGSEYEQGRDAEKAFSSYARISVAGSEAGYRKESERKSTKYSLKSAARSERDHAEERENEFTTYARVSVGEAYMDMPSPSGSGLKIKKYENELYSDNEKELSVSGLVVQDEDDHDEDEDYDAFLELSAETRAKLQYQVRVVLVSPLFEGKDRKLSAFSGVYKKKFGRDLEETGFSSAARLCRAMPHVVQRSRLEKEGELILVDSAKNRRAVAGIRSGLRRIVHDVLKESSEKMSFEQLEERCSELLGAPLVDILTEHGYDTPTVECLVKDMPDIVACEKDGPKRGASLCAGAEDPALSDGLLIKSSPSMRNIIYTPDKKQSTDLENLPQATSELTNAPIVIEPQLELTPDKLKLSKKQKVGSNLTMRGLKNEIRRYDVTPGPAHSLEDEILQARLRIRILLAFHNSGHGVEVSHLCELYEATFKASIDLQLLGFSSVLELARSWHDIFLFQEPRPDWVFLVPLEANKRILNTVRTGLRSAVYHVLSKVYPDGLEPSDFVHRLQESQDGKLWEVLQNNGYSCSEPGKLERFLISKFQLADFEEIRLLLDDMMDFVRLGSNEDGSLVIKLISEKYPLLDLVDCKMEETDLGSFDELFVNLMMLAVDEEDGGADDGSDNGSKQGDAESLIVDQVPITVGLVRARVECFENGGLRDAHTPTPDNLRFKHEIRLILASPEYIEKGVAWSELNKIYKDRAGQELGSRTKVKKLLRDMPDIVCKESLTERYARLSKTPKNMRILSATRAGLRQVLFWALLKNPGGVWANLLEGWFADFAGMSLAATLLSHGYEASKCKPLFPVSSLLRDMSDLLEKRFPHCEVYAWAGEVQDPVHQDATLLGIPELMIQYDPLRGDTQSVPDRVAALYKEFVEKAALKEDKSSEEDHQSDSESDEGSTNDIAEKPVTDAEKHGAFNEPAVPHLVDLEIKRSSSETMEEVPAQDTIVIQPEMEETVLKIDIPEEIAEKAAVVEEQAQCETRAETVVTDVTAGESFVEVEGDMISLNFRDERIEESEKLTDADTAVCEDRVKTEDEEYNGDIEGNGESESEDNEEDKRVYISENRDEWEADHERVYVLGGSSEELRRGDDERVYVPGSSSEGLRVRKEEDDKENDDSVAEAYAQLRVHGKGPAVNLDEWQFTDSDEDYGMDEDDDYEDDEVEEEDEGSGGSDVQPKVDQKQPRVTVAYDNDSNSKDSKKAWVLPSKGIHVK
ncbi:hypothetical protein MPTK1_5g13470 [Marchantia polymorpha subsp. ruderalis]|uniref:HTH OST-type domain-containing protein n=2 Tax=Marchantia polymorpha TaxID=3197 RepID=A0AAF6BHY9_MARPO|nr:hypothetical protein MARPO_0032s0040 [Marchantia polymorpha]BBN11622.1 hypothetical protein Mp_5g13470 [Marchantia polymorpha subsp. ruderalis]PTQ41837.1 hypothetical protein MARPO_0032s0040 [Marchantia polymorpha]PTQ41838.1 hypothetical protein MARPO_0032s0040 [Marchantia polymorpha]BBN11623.1 hypothetical protein Mp_5g13470 [Marchantia polymorpha subsp. ruderalis]|eukprot:PTQ41836.1 hypothetical protein MARPO_0032s0040 [Marchantia polymorpha]